MTTSTKTMQNLDLVELSDADTDALCDAMVAYHAFDTWFHGSSRDDPQTLLENLLDNPTSKLRYKAGYQSVRNRLMEKYGCDERTLVASLIMTYAVTLRESVGSGR